MQAQAMRLQLQHAHGEPFSQLEGRKPRPALSARGCGWIVAAVTCCILWRHESFSFLPPPCAKGSRAATKSASALDIRPPATLQNLRRREGAAAALLGLSFPEAWPASTLPVNAEEVYQFNEEEKQNINLFEQNAEGVVFITNEVFQLSSFNDEFYQVDKVPQGSGTGWVFDQDGHIVTNYHVIKDANELQVRFLDGTQQVAKVVGVDPGSDVAVLEVKYPENKGRVLPRPLVRGVSATLKVGQEVYAIGNPFGLDNTLTKGIVSGVGRTIMAGGGRPVQGAIQTDAAINPGNSGGPLLNSKGQVVGMNTVIISPSGGSSGVGFAIPIDTVAARVQSILKFGYVKRPNFGIVLGKDGLARRLCGKDGVLVVRVLEGGSAALSGVRPLDVLLQIDSRRIKTSNDVFAELDLHEPGDTVKVQLLRPEDPEAAVSDAGSAYQAVTLQVKLQEAVPLKGTKQQVR
mmetsp:Transcript_23455/g.54680  ORF Transcript_23455/g.54680 Transcript_23455/m.54680 type:complete len:461 (-) Transcript_23455:188-1570(-)